MRILTALILLTLLGCGPKEVFEKEVDLGEDWSYDEVMSFEIDVTDTTQLYDLHFELSHSSYFTYQNLYVLISTTYPDGTEIKDQVSLQLADKLGEFNGNCSGEKCMVNIVLQENFRFQNKGMHIIAIAQHSRKEVLKEIFAGKLKLIEAKK